MPSFDSFWHWLGWVVIIAIVAEAIALAVRGKNNN
jgi:hypothetical protein